MCVYASSSPTIAKQGKFPQRYVRTGGILGLGITSSGLRSIMTDRQERDRGFNKGFTERSTIHLLGRAGRCSSRRRGLFVQSTSRRLEHVVQCRNRRRARAARCMSRRLGHVPFWFFWGGGFGGGRTGCFVCYKIWLK